MAPAAVHIPTVQASTHCCRHDCCRCCGIAVLGAAAAVPVSCLRTLVWQRTHAVGHPVFQNLLRCQHLQCLMLASPASACRLLQAALRKDFSVSAQNCWVGKGGAFTGELRCACGAASCACLEERAVGSQLTAGWGRAAPLLSWIGTAAVFLWPLPCSTLPFTIPITAPRVCWCLYHTPPGSLPCSAEMLKDLGLNWVILGHSERRHILKESDEVRMGCG